MNQSDKELKRIAFEMLIDGMPESLVAGFVGVTEDAIKQWIANTNNLNNKNKILSLMHKGMTCSEIGKALGVSPEVAHDLVVAEWRKQKEGR